MTPDYETVELMRLMERMENDVLTTVQRYVNQIEDAGDPTFAEQFALNALMHLVGHLMRAAVDSNPEINLPRCMALLEETSRTISPLSEPRVN